MAMDVAPVTGPGRDGQRVASPVLDAAVSGVGLVPAFQPIVALPEQTVVGFEALARWPGEPGLNPAVVFAHAEATGRLPQFDGLCVEAAITSALQHRLGSQGLLCVNCEPTSPAVFPGRDSVLARGRAQLQVMFELTERRLLTHPHVLLAKVAALRAQGFAIALDDVGAHPDSLALLDVLHPEVIKLDLGLVQSQPNDHQARTLSAVWAHHERSGAVILAEGIETEEHLEQALSVGATLGQGYLFGRPGPLEGFAPATEWSPPATRSPRAAASGSPFDLVQGHLGTRIGRKQTLTAFSRHIESQARHAADPPILLTALQDAGRFTGRTRQDYRDFATRSPLVAIFGEDLPTDLGPGIRGVPLPPGDVLSTEWTVVALGPHTAAALIARECAADNAHHHRRDEDRRFEFVITYDRAVVTAAACHLLDRIT